MFSHTTVISRYCSIKGRFRTLTINAQSLSRCPFGCRLRLFFCVFFVNIRRYSIANPQSVYLRLCITMSLIHIIIMSDIERDMVNVMIDTRIGKRIKQCRERLGLTQEQFAEKTGFTANYISTLERGASFPRCENLIKLLNALEVSADAIFCDVVDHSTKYKSNQLSKDLDALPLDAQKRIIQMVELMIEQEKNNRK